MSDMSKPCPTDYGCGGTGTRMDAEQREVYCECPLGAKLRARDEEFKPTETLMTMDEARALVARTTARSLKSSLEQYTLALMTSEVSLENQKRIVAASKELHDSLVLQARRFERPAILRPTRRVKVVR